ncbi:hypothetical protein TgHK011_004971 [Trichoderma gracile]|nr:hypothetical protein TgHK011_004971 [Trichoderma gracile]
MRPILTPHGPLSCHVDLGSSACSVSENFGGQQSCSACRRSKAKCDGKRPRSRCSDLKKICTFIDPPKQAHGIRIEEPAGISDTPILYSPRAPHAPFQKTQQISFRNWPVTISPSSFKDVTITFRCFILAVTRSKASAQEAVFCWGPYVQLPVASRRGLEPSNGGCHVILKSPAATELDLFLFSQVKLNAVRGRIYDSMSGLVGFSNEDAMIDVVREAKIDHCSMCWAENMALYRVLRASGVEDVDFMSPTQKSVVTKAKDALEEHLDIMIESRGSIHAIYASQWTSSGQSAHFATYYCSNSPFYCREVGDAAVESSWNTFTFSWPS